jgi:hypothetical protein
MTWAWKTWTLLTLGRSEEPLIRRTSCWAWCSRTKTATSSLLWSYEAEDEPLPTEGEVSIVCDGQGRPLALLRLTDVTVTNLDDVSERHAFAEGEGDRTLAYWRRAHEDFFRSHLPAGANSPGACPSFWSASSGSFPRPRDPGPPARCT